MADLFDFLAQPVDPVSLMLEAWPALDDSTHGRRWFYYPAPGCELRVLFLDHYRPDARKCGLPVTGWTVHGVGMAPIRAVFAAIERWAFEKTGIRVSSGQCSWTHSWRGETRPWMWERDFRSEDDRRCLHLGLPRRMWPDGFQTINWTN